jgi:magnesium transporter
VNQGLSGGLMIRSLFFSQNGNITLDLSQERWAAAIAESAGLLWVDFEGNRPEEDESLLRDIFHFHPLAIDDALQESHVPKVDDWQDYLYIVLHSVLFSTNHEPHLEMQELDIFLGENYVVTHHDQKIQAIERVWASIQRDERHLRSGADHLLYRLVDEVVASYMPVVEALDDAIDQVEEEVFSGPNSATLARIFALKRAVVTLRRTISPERETLNKLARDDYPVIDPHDRVYFRDVYDHLVRLVDITEGIRDLIGGVLDTYLSAVNNRMNDIMKTLTIITTLFMPITYIAGFFGMNFFGVPELDPYHAWMRPAMFTGSLILMILVPILMFLYMKSRKWM